MATRCLDSARPLRTSCVAALLLALAATFSVSSAGAQRRTPLLSIGFGGGVTVPTGNAKDAYRSGVNGQGFLLVRLGPLPALRFNLAYQKFDYKQALGLGDAYTNILSGTGGLSINLLPGPVRPYITAGLGAFDVRSVSDSTTGGQTTSKVHFGIDGGAGLAISFGRVSAFAEGRVQNIYTNDGGVANAKSIQAIPVTFGILIGL